MSSYENTASNAYRLWYSISSANNDLIAEYSNERTDQYWTAIHGPIEDVHGGGQSIWIACPIVI